jgi:hypothetical protein
MATKKAILGSVLIKELIAIRTDTLWRMLSCLQQGQLPGVNEEGATGKLDNMDSPYGSRTRISTCVSIGLTDPHMYFAYCKTEFSLSRRRLNSFAARLDTAQERSELADGTVLYPPYVVVCHDTRYKENSLTGLIRILGIGRFGEFSTFSFEILNNQLTGEMKRKKIVYGKEHIFAEHGGVSVLGVLRTYKPTNPGKRSLKYRLDLVSPEKDVDINLDQMADQARERYQIKAVRP